MADVTIQDLPDKTAAFDLTTDYIEVEEDVTGTPKSVGVPFEDLPFLQRIIGVQEQYSIPFFSAPNSNLTGASNITTDPGGNNLAIPGILQMGGTPQVVSGAGIVDITSAITHFVSTGTGDAITLADGTQGQIKTIIYVAKTNGTDTGVLTPANFGNGTTVTLTDVSDSITLQFTNSAWYLISSYGNIVVA